MYRVHSPLLHTHSIQYELLGVLVGIEGHTFFAVITCLHKSPIKVISERKLNNNLHDSSCYLLMDLFKECFKSLHYVFSSLGTDLIKMNYVEILSILKKNYNKEKK